MLIAAEKTGRLARLIEYGPLYCDMVLRRWQHVTGKRAKLAVTGLSVEDHEQATAGAGQGCEQAPKRDPTPDGFNSLRILQSFYVYRALDRRRP
jgi:hypothetical protein